MGRSQPTNQLAIWHYVAMTGALAGFGFFQASPACTKHRQKCMVRIRNYFERASITELQGLLGPRSSNASPAAHQPPATALSTMPWLTPVSPVSHLPMPSPYPWSLIKAAIKAQKCLTLSGDSSIGACCGCGAGAGASGCAARCSASLRSISSWKSLGSHAPCYGATMVGSHDGHLVTC